MKISTLRQLTLSAAIAMSPLLLLSACAENGRMGTSHETAHSESVSTGWFGGTTHKANTSYSNSDGSTSIETETSTTKGNTTTVVRERKTTTADGKVTTDRETHTMVKGSDNVVRESSSSN